MSRFYRGIYLTGIFFLMLICEGNTIKLSAQNVADPSDEMSEYTDLTLPPLDALFENARNAPRYEYQRVQEEVQRRLLKKEKRAFLGFFSIRGSWQYGTFANDGYLSMEIQQPTYSYTKTTQTLYSVGASINIPLETLFDLGARVKRQKLNLRAAELSTEMQFEEVKKEIVQVYTMATTQLNILKLRAEAVVLANTQYAIVERNFIHGTANSDLLATEKEKQSISMERYETSKSELIKNIMILEIITGTPILRK